LGIFTQDKGSDGPLVMLGILLSRKRRGDAGPQSS